MTNFKHGIRYPISEHVPPNGKCLFWRGETILPFGVLADKLVYSSTDIACATHFSLWPEEAPERKPPSAQSIIDDVLTLQDDKYFDVVPVSTEIISTLSRNGYHIIRKDAPPVKGVEINYDEIDTQEYIVPNPFAPTEYKTHEPSKPKEPSWAEYVNEGGDFDNQMNLTGPAGVYIGHKVTDKSARAALAFLNHHLGENND